ncbi:hypothetical protein V865_002830 [Kwoniella europaea PYCC6329]|uniref:Extracellular membrane protein CFEM domain-containing protein n=1 Tax=Kwoniella europaea PYCC6329 TaxID=1423913 RepID=A0AAX4KFE5_9TREE
MYSAYLAPVGVFTFLTLTQQVVADSLFSGCYKIDGSTFTNQQEDEPNSSLDAQSPCIQTFCGNDGYAYSAWKDDNSLCYCSNNYPQEYYLLSGSHAACDSPSDLNVRITQTSFMRIAMVLMELHILQIPKMDIILAIVNRDDLVAQGDSVTCSASNYFLFYHSQAAQA